ncbi:MAG: hypothetical protein JRN73_09445 [Nitrososphaerota archaeon]|nr:hypothetical protein [Nitrososphaerota archaeon]MDG7020185.1 hypothetical protein [Nitrososphaerota archaeon]
MKAVPVALAAAVMLGLTLLASAAPVAAAPARSPAGLLVTAIPPTLPADSAAHEAVVVSLVDGSGAPTLSFSNLTIYLSSSNAAVAVAPASVTLLAGQAFVQVPVTTTSVPGSTVFAASSAGLASSSVRIDTVPLAPEAAALKLFLGPPSSVVSLSGEDGAYAIQAVDANGNPAVSQGGTGFVITSSNSSLLPGTLSGTIAPGSDLAYGEFQVEGAGSATLTALAPRLATGSAQLSMAPVPVVFSVTADPPYLTLFETGTVTVSVTVLGMPFPGLTASVSASQGTLVPSGEVSLGEGGQATVNFIPSQPGPVTVTASSTSSLLGVLSGSATIVVTQQTSSTTGSAPVLAGVDIWLYIPVLAAVIVAAAGYVIVRTTLRRRKPTPEDEYQADSKA